jgi:hypothetical protein
MYITTQNLFSYWGISLHTNYKPHVLPQLAAHSPPSVWLATSRLAYQCHTQVSHFPFWFSLHSIVPLCTILSYRVSRKDIATLKHVKGSLNILYSLSLFLSVQTSLHCQLSFYFFSYSCWFSVS